MLAVLVSSVILAVLSCAMGVISAKSGLSLGLLSKYSFGKAGTYVPVAIVVITTIGWFSIDAYLIGQTTNTLFPVIPTASRAPGAPRSSTSWLPSPRTTRSPSAGSAVSTRPTWTWCSVSWAARP